MTWYEQIINAHVAVTDSVSHARRLTSERYFVWQEDGSHDLTAGNGHAERAMTGVTDLYTKTPFDPWGDALGESLTRHGIAWSLVSLDYEEDTRFFHWSWDWEVAV